MATTPSPGLKGLVNQSAQCYCNAVLQILVNSLPLTRYMLQECVARGPVAAALQRLTIDYWKDEPAVCSGADVIKAIESLNQSGVVAHRQGDATEFYALVLEQCQKQTTTVDKAQRGQRIRQSRTWDDYVDKFPSPVTPIFWGLERLTTQFTECTHASVREEIMGPVIMSIPLATQPNQQQSIDLATIIRTHYQPHEVTVNCSECGGQKRKATHYINTVRPPAVLSLWIKRWEETPRGLIRNNMPVEIPTALTVVVAGVPERRKLFGVLCHQGSVEGGHWTCLLVKRDKLMSVSDQMISVAADPVPEVIRSDEAVALFYY